MTRRWAITRRKILGRPSDQSNLSAALRPPPGLAGLTGPPGRLASGQLRDGPPLARRDICNSVHTQEEDFMDTQTLTPSIEVAIGRELRLYHA